MIECKLYPVQKKRGFIPASQLTQTNFPKLSSQGSVSNSDY